MKEQVKDSNLTVLSSIIHDYIVFAYPTQYDQKGVKPNCFQFSWLELQGLEGSKKAALEG